jgi:hypothetical protein
MFIFEVTVVLYFIKILGGSRNFYRLRMTSLTYVNECFHDFMVVNRTPPGKFSSTALLQSLAKSLLHYSSTIRHLFADYSYYSSTIRGLFVLFVDYSRRTISIYSSTIRWLFVLFVDYSHYSLHYSSFINCPLLYATHALWFRTARKLICIYCRKDTNPMFISFKSRSVVLFHTFGTVHKTIISEMLWAHNRRASWDPFIPSASNKAQPYFPSPDRYGWIIIPKRYLVDRNTLVCVSNVGTTVNDTPFRHFKARTLEVASTCNTKANERRRTCSSDPGFYSEFWLRDFFFQNDRIWVFEPLYLRN